MAGGNTGDEPIDQNVINAAIAECEVILDRVGLELIGTRPKTRG